MDNFIDFIDFIDFINFINFINFIKSIYLICGTLFDIEKVKILDKSL